MRQTLSVKSWHHLLQAERLAAIGKFARSIVHDLKNPVTADDLRKALTDKVMKLTDASTPSGWEEIPQFVVESDYPRDNVYARPNIPK